MNRKTIPLLRRGLAWIIRTAAEPQPKARNLDTERTEVQSEDTEKGILTVASCSFSVPSVTQGLGIRLANPKNLPRRR